MCQPAVRVMRSKFSTDAWHAPAHYRIPAGTAAAAPRPGPGQPRRQKTPFCLRTHTHSPTSEEEARRCEARRGVRRCAKIVRALHADNGIRKVTRSVRVAVAALLRRGVCVRVCVCVSERERERSLAGEDGFTRRATGVWNGIVSERGSSFL